MSTPVAYLRKSRVIDESKDVSWDVQEGKVRDLAALHGDNGGRLVILSDWNVSGRKGADKRPGYARLLEMITSGEASAIYSYNLARLSRSTHDLLELVKLAKDNGVPVRLVADSVDTTTATGQMLLTVLAAVDEMTAALASEHARDAAEARRARGDRLGSPFYGERKGEDVGAVVRAFQEAGSVMGAAKLLNKWAVPTRQGREWGSTPVRAILTREGVMPLRTRRGAKQRAPFMFYGLLRCHCGHILTGARYRTSTTYRCYKARSVPNHGRGWISERAILDSIKAEAAHLALPATAEIERLRDDSREKLERRRAFLLDAMEHEDIRPDEYRRRMDAVKAEERQIVEAEADLEVVNIPALDWSQPPEIVNAILGAMWERVELDENLTPKPKGFVWRRKEWRSA